MLIREAEAADLDGAARLRVLHSGGDPAEWIERLGGDLGSPDRGLFVALMGDVVVGYGRSMAFEPTDDHPGNVAPPGDYLIGLVVDPGHRRRHIGAQLVEARLVWAQRRGSAEAWYFTNAQNVISQRLHHRFGFCEVTRDFSFPGVRFDGGVGILSRAPLTSHGYVAPARCGLAGQRYSPDHGG